MNRRIEKIYQKFDKFLKKKDFKGFEKFFNKLGNLKVHPYYYVPQCPNCRSFVTGRFLNEHRITEKEWIEGDTLRKGEIIQFRNVQDEHNCFCLSCGNEWSGQVQLKMMSSKQIEAEKLKRHINELLIAVNEREDEEYKQRKFVSFRGFVGKL